MKPKRILVFAKGDRADEARAFGATHVGDDDLINRLKAVGMNLMLLLQLLI